MINSSKKNDRIIDMILNTVEGVNVLVDIIIVFCGVIIIVPVLIFVVVAILIHVSVANFRDGINRRYGRYGPTTKL